ncbi:MAG: methionyl-tRNA formyltransferase [Patescibacteria group bacterium]|nr:methionyl-tRNA formyltransferase [Patescibacteria group bacterium]
MHSNNHKIKTIFIGTPDFGIPAFRALMQDKQFEIIAVITQLDKPVGRKQILTPPPIKIEAIKHKIPIFQPKEIADLQFEIKNLKPEIIVVIAYAQLIPEQILNIPKFGCINVHGSLLPKYRGASVIQAPILNNDKQTGITIIKMDKGLDTGPILAQAAINIKSAETSETLYDKLSQLGADLLPGVLKKYIVGKIKPRPQDETKASYVKQIKKKYGLIDWARTAMEIERFVRAMASWPSAWIWWKNKRLKIITVQQQPLPINSYKQGKIFIYNSGLAVQCGKDALIIKKLQLEGKKEMNSDEFLKGHRDFVGSVLLNKHAAVV